jgi:S-adenosylhomocysteine hydrolase
MTATKNSFSSLYRLPKSIETEMYFESTHHTSAQIFLLTERKKNYIKVTTLCI